MNYYDAISFTKIFALLISLVIVLVIFIIAYRLRKIEEYLENMHDLEVRKEENRKIVVCSNCGEKNSILVTNNSSFSCQNCKKITKII